MCRKERMLAVAAKEVDLSKNRQNLVAILEKGGSILSIGTNDMDKTHPAYWNGDFDKRVHAEFDALRKAQDPTGANMYVFYFKRSGGLGNSRPCKHCLSEIKKSGVSRIHYIKNGKMVKESV